MKRLLKQNQNNRREAHISKEEFRALRKLKIDKNRLILTADKGVALIVIDKADYIKKAKELLKEKAYKKITGYTQQVQGHPNFMGCQKYINLAYHSGP